MYKYMLNSVVKISMIFAKYLECYTIMLVGGVLLCNCMWPSHAMFVDRDHRQLAVWAHAHCAVWRLDSLLCTLLSCTVAVEDTAGDVFVVASPRCISGPVASCQRCFHNATATQHIWHSTTAANPTRYFLWCSANIAHFSDFYPHNAS